MIESTAEYRRALIKVLRLQAELERARQHHLDTGHSDADRVVRLSCELFDLEVDIRRYREHAPDAPT